MIRRDDRDSDLDGPAGDLSDPANDLGLSVIDLDGPAIDLDASANALILPDFDRDDPDNDLGGSADDLGDPADDLDGSSIDLDAPVNVMSVSVNDLDGLDQYSEASSMAFDPGRSGTPAVGTSAARLPRPLAWANVTRPYRPQTLRQRAA